MTALNWLVKRLIDPVALVWLGIICLAVFLWRRKRYAESSVLFGVCVMLSLFGGSTLPHVLIASIEKPYFGTELSQVPEADVVIVLGGHVSIGEGEPHGFDSGDAIDRVLAGVELIRAGKGKLLLMGGGAADPPPHKLTEYDVIKPWLERWDLVDTPVRHLQLCRNTFEEAQAVRRMKEEEDWAEIILVTSAIHMRRAEAVFESAGVSVTPVACDFRSLPRRHNYLIPSSSGLLNLRYWLHETVGIQTYRWRGWIKD